MTRMTKNVAQLAAGPVAKLADSELVLLSSAAKRDDGLTEIPTGMKASSVGRAVGSLLKRGLLEEVEAGRGQPVWREREGRRLALRITDAGWAAIGIDPRESAGRPAGDSATAEGATGEARNPAEPEAGPDRPREGSKGALVVGLLSRASGARLDEIIEATGWLPHTTRAALTGLRRRSYEILRDKDESGRTTYRIEVEPPKPVRTGRRRRPQVNAAAAA